MTSRRRMIVSGVNLVEGGTLTVLRDFLAATRGFDDWEVIALVHDASLVDEPSVRLIELRDPKRSWLRRMRFEWFTARKLSAKLQPDLWVSLHDVTSRVAAKAQVVYCHNPSPFHRLTVREAYYDPKFMLFCLFYGWLYGLRIHRNDAVIVQQEWIREAFERRWQLDNIIVAHPRAKPIHEATVDASKTVRPAKRFVYPTLPRVFKNIEIVGEAVRILETNPQWDGVVALTVDGSEGRYASALRSRYGDLTSLQFLGRQDRAGMAALYERSDCLLFPSKLETWGLPITEFKATGRPMIVADLPYARETVDDYPQAMFVSSKDPGALAAAMLKANCGDFVAAAVEPPPHSANFAPDWPALISRITQLPA